jgi:hypothetical protein
LVAHNIAFGTKSALDDLLGVIANRLTALRDIKDGEVAEQRLATFRRDFESVRACFQSAAESDVALLRANLADADKRNVRLIETIGLLAERELAEFETNDVGRHWHTRRKGRWGYMRDLQGRVANRIFPRVQEMLSDMTAHFAVFIDHFAKHLSALSASSGELAGKLDLGATIPFDLTKTLAGSLDRSLSAANDLIAAEELHIVSFLDDFVSDEVSDKISAARKKVTEIGGTGTTIYQSREVRLFYAEVKRLLQEALTAHISERGTAFGEFLANEAGGVPRNALAEVQATLASAEQDIKAAAMARIGGEREAFEHDCDILSTALLSVVASCAPFLDAEDDPEPTASPPPSPVTAEVSAPARSVWTNDAPGHAWVDAIRLAATKTIERYHLRDGASGWTFDRLFPASLLVGCKRIALIDPYLAQPHQVRNLKEFLLAVAEVAKPKEIHVFTSGTWREGSGVHVGIVEQVGADLFRDFGMSLSIEVDQTVHDRSVVCDHGIIFKLGRGLDIYKPALGLASHRPGNRRVRRTEIDIFGADEWIKLHQQ